jgi:hypothetical protein
VLFSCGSTTKITDRANIVEASSRQIIKNHYKNTFDENTLSADLKVNYKSGKNSQGLKIKLRIKKDETIWLSGSVYGFTIAKAIITPTRVSYYMKFPSKTYFEGDFSSISDLLGAELNFTMLQNLLLGDALFKLKSKNFEAEIDQQAYLLTPKSQKAIADILFWIHPLNYKIEKQEIKSREDNKFLAITYKNYQTINTTEIPGAIEVLTKGDKNNTTIHIDYKSVRINENLSFPYKIPSGYKRIQK